MSIWWLVAYCVVAWVFMAVGTTRYLRQNPPKTKQECNYYSMAAVIVVCLAPVTLPYGWLLLLVEVIRVALAGPKPKV